MKNILFLENKFSMQGTTRAVLDYALFNEKILNNKSFLTFGGRISSPPWDQPYYKNTVDTTIESASKRFTLLEYNNHDEIENFIIKNNIEGVYHIKSGEPGGFHSSHAKNLIHSVFPQPKCNVHGDRFAFVSKWLSDVCSGGDIPFVPHMVNAPSIDKDLCRKEVREYLNIPQNAFVYGRIGGYTDFDIPFVFESIKEALDKRSDLYFMLICTKPFYQHERIIYIDPILDLKQKYRYIAATDAMIHARNHGETFGLAVAEFCFLNKPILTWDNSIGKGYMDILQNDAIYYNNQKDLLDLFLNFTPEANKDYNSYKEYNPQTVMEKFNKVFLN
jgi:hypothetical protein